MSEQQKKPRLPRLPIPVEVASLGITKAWAVTPDVWDGVHKADAAGVPQWRVEVSTDLGRFRVKVASPQPPLGGAGVYDDGVVVVIGGLKVVSWSGYGPTFEARSVAAVEVGRG